VRLCGRRFSIPDRSRDLLRHAGRHALGLLRGIALVALGDMPTSSVKRVLKVPSDEQPTSKQTSVTLRSPRRSSAIARSMRRVIK